MRLTSRLVLGDKVINRKIDAIKTKYLKRAGAYVRKIARDFVKHKGDPNVHSKPYHSPYDHFGLKNSIIFGVEGNSVYIGPRYIRGGLANVARLHEFGGMAVVNGLKKASKGSVEIGSVSPVTSNYVIKGKDVPVRREVKKDPKTGRDVFWIKIRTKSQASHSYRVYNRMFADSREKRLVKYAPRPYMLPALMKSLPHLPEMLKGIVN